MSRFNQNHGYGRVQTSGHPLLGIGKIFFVGDSSTVQLDMLNELFPVDQDGVPRVHATLDAAVGFCTADAGDIIYVLPGHTETVTTAGAIDLDVAGISIIGLGNGRLRPTINFTTATGADIDIDAANITVENIFFDLTGIDALAAPIDVNSSDFTLRNCEILLSDSSGQATLGVLTASGVDRLTIEDCTFMGDSSVGCTAAIRVIGGDQHRIVGNTIYADFDTTGCAIENLTTATTNYTVEYNNIWNKHTGSIVCINAVSTSTGNISYNLLQMELNGISGCITDTGTGATNFALFENYYSNLDGEAGALCLGGGGLSVSST